MAWCKGIGRREAANPASAEPFSGEALAEGITRHQKGTPTGKLTALNPGLLGGMLAWFRDHGEQHLSARPVSEPLLRHLHLTIE